MAKSTAKGIKKIINPVDDFKKDSIGGKVIYVLGGISVVGMTINLFNKIFKKGV